MKNLFLLLCATLLFSSSCDDDNNLVDLLIYDQEGIKIFVEEIEDTRCPSDVVCIWEGDAIVTMLMLANGQSQNFELHTHPNDVNQMNVLGHLVTLVELTPYPVSTEPLPELAAYEVMITVE